MPYDPFARGPHPVGVRTVSVLDAARGGRTLPLELWYPAHERHRGQDLAGETRDRFRAAPGEPEQRQRAVRDAAPAGDRCALALFFHGGLSFRQSASELCTHLASHGYVVASPDFVGHTRADQLAALQSGLGTADPRLHSNEASAAHRPADAHLVLNHLLTDGADDLRIDPERVGSLGLSFGGWTALALNSIDRRPRATFAIVPAWGRNGMLAELADRLRLDDWQRPVPCLVLAAGRDGIVPLAGLRELFGQLPPPKRFAVLRDAGHVHFGDDPEARHEQVRSMLVSAVSPMGAQRGAELREAIGPFSALCPAAHGTDTVRALALAHLDAHVRERAEAAVFFASDLHLAFGRRGIALDVE
jgi:predicted dienelactone hydrolase